ncbi:hypothetical protein ABZT06_08370 [Streptomyces sp. NPDC005483]|uniref:hypothetical protein n=1 Tax=Streptomyces sp. NPDC005483 TaxID=3154882 RepID=UPI0033A75EF3
MTPPQPDADGLPCSDSLGTGEAAGSLGDSVGDGVGIDDVGLVGGRLVDGDRVVDDGAGVGLS